MKNFKSLVVSTFCLLWHSTLVFGTFVETDQVENPENNIWSSFVYDVATRQNDLSNCILRFVLQSNDTKEKKSIMKALLPISFR